MNSSWDQFCVDILKMKQSNENEKEIVCEVVGQELEKVYQYTHDLEGLCKIVGNNIYQSLINQGILVRQVNVQDYFGKYGKDHLFLIAYVNDLRSPFLLIDPTFRQFCSKEGMTVLPPLSDFPDQYLSLIKPSLLRYLMGRGVVNIDDNDYQIYLSSLVADHIVDRNICLDDVVFRRNIGGIR